MPLRSFIVLLATLQRLFTDRPALPNKWESWGGGVEIRAPCKQLLSSEPLPHARHWAQCLTPVAPLNPHDLRDRPWPHLAVEETEAQGPSDGT